MRTSIHIAAAAGLALGIASTAFAAPSDSSDFPPAYVERPLTLPKLMLSPEFSLPIIHAESAGSPAFGSATANLVGLNLGAALGITDDFQIDTTPLSLLIADVSVPVFGSQTKVYYGTFHLGAMYRFVGRNAQLAKSDVAEVGARIEFGASGLNDTIHLTWGIPVILHFAKLVRIDTGLFFTGAFPVKGTAQNDIGMGSVGSTPAILGAVEPPGIPVSVTLGNDFIFGGVDLGFGIASFRGSDISRNCYMPLGFHLGGTIPKDQKPLIDITGNFTFPYFLIGADANPPTSRLWMVGLDAKGYFQL